MAFSFQILEDGPRNLVVHVQGVSTTNPADLLVDVSSLSTDPTTKAPCTRVSLREVSYDVGVDDPQAGTANVTLFWDATVDTQFLLMTSGSGQSICWDHLGGVNNPMGAGATGDVLLSSTGGLFSITLKFRKKYN
jgi:hypothetical protein